MRSLILDARNILGVLPVLAPVHAVLALMRTSGFGSRRIARSESRLREELDIRLNLRRHLFQSYEVVYFRVFFPSRGNRRTGPENRAEGIESVEYLTQQQDILVLVRVQAELNWAGGSVDSSVNEKSGLSEQMGWLRGNGDIWKELSDS